MTVTARDIERTPLRDRMPHGRSLRRAARHLWRPPATRRQFSRQRVAVLVIGSVLAILLALVGA